MLSRREWSKQEEAGWREGRKEGDAKVELLVEAELKQGECWGEVRKEEAGNVEVELLVEAELKQGEC